MKKHRVKKWLVSSEFYVLLTIILFVAIIQIRTGQFFANNNLVDLARSMIIPCMYAICALLSFVSTGPDISFPMIAAVSAYVATIASDVEGFPMIGVFAIAGAVGLLLGAINGFIIVRYQFPSLIVTVGTTSIFSGILLGVFNAKRIALPLVMQQFGKSILVSVKNTNTGLGSSLPSAFLLMIGLYVVAYVVLNYTMAGRGVYAIGGDESAAERAGFNVKAIRFGVFCCIGLVASIAGVTYTCISQRFLPTEFAGSEMTVIAAIILGGTRMKGGIGTLTGCILGTLLITMVTNSLILLGISVYWQRVFVGVIIIAGTAISVLQSRKPTRSTTQKEATYES